MLMGFEKSILRCKIERKRPKASVPERALTASPSFLLVTTLLSPLPSPQDLSLSFLSKHPILSCLSPTQELPAPSQPPKHFLEHQALRNLFSRAWWSMCERSSLLQSGHYEVPLYSRALPGPLRVAGTARRHCVGSKASEGTSRSLKVSMPHGVP